jgi:hypothetical protein
MIAPAHRPKPAVSTGASAYPDLQASAMIEVD